MTGLVVESRDDVLLAELDKHYTNNPEALDTLKKVLKRNGRMSLRMSLRALDWLVTNYCKKTNIVYQVNVNGRETTFNMYLAYKALLDGYSKKLFDPFCRRKRIDFHGLKTTCGQLNFFKWAIQYGVLQYAIDHREAIEEDMVQHTQHRQVKEVTHKPVMVQEPEVAKPLPPIVDLPAKRKELSKAAIKTCTTTRVKVKLKFS